MNCANRLGYAVVCLIGAAHFARAQGSLSSTCDLEFERGGGTDTIAGQPRISFGRQVTVTCKSRNLVLKADSGQQVGEVRVELFGHVHYDEKGKLDLHSDYLTYFQADERIVARGNVVAKLASGSTLTGPEATYLRVIPNRRPFEEITAVQHPTVVVVAKGDSGKSVTINAATVYMKGDSLTYASKNVVITRSDLIAKADSAFLDGRGGKETIRLMFKPSIEGLSGRKFTLEGELIDAYSANRKLDRVIARGKGHATSRDLEIVSDTIDLRMANDAIERAIAWNYKGQAKATSPSETITADSLDVGMPNGKVQVVYAVRNAHAEAKADSVRFRTTENDWLSGDTVTAWFDPPTPRPTSAGTDTTTSTPPIKRILARHVAHSARAYYHLAASDTSRHLPAIAYVMGRGIQLDFDNRKVGLVTVDDSVYGVYLEPKSVKDTTKAAATKPGTKGPANTKAAPGKQPPAATSTKPPAAVTKPPAGAVVPTKPPASPLAVKPAGPQTVRAVEFSQDMS